MDSLNPEWIHSDEGLSHETSILHPLRWLNYLIDFVVHILEFISSSWLEEECSLDNDSARGHTDRRMLSRVLFKQFNAG